MTTQQLHSMESVFPGPSVEDPGELDLSDDESRIVQAQKILNQVGRIYDSNEKDDFDDELFTEVRVLLSQAGMILMTAGYEKEDIEEIARAVKYIQHAKDPEEFGHSEADEYKVLHLAVSSIYEASRIDPMRDL